MEDYTEQNRKAWNEIAQVRANTFPPADFFAGGGSVLGQELVDAVRRYHPDLTGLKLIHLQCATGEETLSWAVLGVRPVGVDISDQEIEIARQKAAGAGLDVRFYAADVYTLPAALPSDARGNYDLVYTGGGAIVWLPDLRRWSEVVAALLRPGGRLVLIEEHPLGNCLWVENGQLQITADYFMRGRPDIVEGWYHFKGGEGAKEIKFEFTWPVGDVVTALAEAGLVIERLEEFPGGPEWRYGELQDKSFHLPGEYLVIARKSA